jgi:branched-chain amino acid transport system permease protein
MKLSGADPIGQAPRQPGMLPALAVLALGAVVPLLLTGEFQLRLAMVVWIYAILCMGFNLLYGFAGQISLGQQAFFAIGAYAFAMVQTKLGWPPSAGLAVAVLLCALAALVIGIPLLRLRTHYLAMATLAFGLICYGVVTRWIDFTGGTSGLAVPPLVLGQQPVSRLGLYYVVLAFGGAVLLLHDFIIRSHLGRALQAIRDDELAASALGAHVTRYKLRIFVLAAAIAAVAGVAFSVVSLRVDPSMTEFSILVTMLTIAVVGGLGTRFGPVIGAIIVVLLPQILTGFGEFETVVYGAFVLIFLLFMPHGLAGLLETTLARRFALRSLSEGHEPRVPLWKLKTQRRS